MILTLLLSIERDTKNITIFGNPDNVHQQLKIYLLLLKFPDYMVYYS